MADLGLRNRLFLYSTLCDLSSVGDAGDDDEGGPCFVLATMRYLCWALSTTKQAERKSKFGPSK